MKKIVVLILCLFKLFLADAQLFSWLNKDNDGKKTEMLLGNRTIQIEAGNAVNAMYNFEFEKADLEYRWFQSKYPDHPIGPFLIGLNAWWKIVPNTKVTKYDEDMEANMDRAIDLAENLLDMDANNKEAAFFASAAYAFKGRLYAEREKWTKATWAGKNALKYLDKTRGNEDLSPEMAIGDGLYNYYSKWIPENYPSLKGILLFFRKGNKEKGMKQLELVANNAFYTRVEARYFLVQVYASEGEHLKAYTMSKYMHQTYPNNPFFHRFLAREAFVLGRLVEAEKVADELLKNIENKKFGYETTEGRYASYIIAYANQNGSGDIQKAKVFYQKVIDYSIEGDAKDSGYFHAANLALGKYADDEKDFAKAREYYKIVIDNAEKKSDQYKQAKVALENNKKLQRTERKRK